MTTFDKREDAFEAKFARDEELRFKAEARRNKLLGLWAAEKLGKSGDEAEALEKVSASRGAVVQIPERDRVGPVRACTACSRLDDGRRVRSLRHMPDQDLAEVQGRRSFANSV